jgi:purine-nucleoside phosphorylase
LAIPLYERATEAARYIASKTERFRPRVAVVLGSGLGGVADAVCDGIEIPYEDIPFFVNSTVEGHAGRLIIGECGGVDALAMKGRLHFYEGYSMEEITLPVRVFSLMGVRALILTNAAGGTSPHLNPGSLMIIRRRVPRPARPVL